ncbi:hypothetical protein [Chitinophaga sp. sic0106]|uniref:hypothetical protein n=1 Tax=Chitinophaga sp. sic0106 TaxID=2854785 RepID=UPI001C43D0BC|nr:hypothetical protein [Chitinophaga sp. sic0106]MBV7529033.1 hypothetical protein [Chitinophaga sp. sic0106]
MKRFKYNGSQPHNSTIHVEEDGRKVRQDIRLSPGEEAMLPGDHPVIIALVDTGLLTLVSVTKPTTTK